MDAVASTFLILFVITLVLLLSVNRELRRESRIVDDLSDQLRTALADRLDDSKRHAAMTARAEAAERKVLSLSGFPPEVEHVITEAVQITKEGQD